MTGPRATTVNMIRTISLTGLLIEVFYLYTTCIIALKAPGRDCTNNNELLHKIWVPCSYSYLQVNFYKQFDGAVSITVVLEESENKA